MEQFFGQKHSFSYGAFEVIRAKTEGLSSFVLMIIIFGLFADAKTDISLKRFTLNQKKMPRKSENPLQFYIENPLQNDRRNYVNRTLPRV